jgi:hypothetical protein
VNRKTNFNGTRPIRTGLEWAVQCVCNGIYFVMTRHGHDMAEYQRQELIACLYLDKNSQFKAVVDGHYMTIDNDVLHIDYFSGVEFDNQDSWVKWNFEK